MSLALSCFIAASLASTLAFAAPVPDWVSAMAAELRPVAGADMEVNRYREMIAQVCQVERRTRVGPPNSRGTVNVRLEGRRRDGGNCIGGAEFSVRFTAPVWVTTRSIRKGETMSGGAEKKRTALAGSRSPVVEPLDGLRAAQDLPVGTIIEKHHLKVAAIGPGEPVQVVLEVGAIKLVQPGRLVACVRPGSVCAVLDSGARVSGRMIDGRLQVEPRP